MAAGAGLGIAADDGDAVVVHQVGGLAVTVLAILGDVPGPVGGGHDLLGRLGVAGQTGARDRRTVTILEGALEDLELAVIGRPGARLRGMRRGVGAVATRRRRGGPLG